VSLPKTSTVGGFIQDRRLCADTLFIHARTTTRADGSPSAQGRSLLLDAKSCADGYERDSSCALARANRDFRTDEKRIRTEITVIVKVKDSAGGLYKIVDCARMSFSSVHNRRSARTGRRPRKVDHCGSIRSPAPMDTNVTAVARSRAPTVFSVRMKGASVRKSRLLLKSKTVRGGYTRSSIVRGCAFHPCTIDDPRGRGAVRAR